MQRTAGILYIIYLKNLHALQAHVSLVHGWPPTATSMVAACGGCGRKGLWRCYTQVQARPPMAVTNAVSWRSEGIRYKKNEVLPSMHAVCRLALCEFCK